ncbi:DNA repair protein rad51d [Perkinsus chesapeaki]|uniref:DNA repair protein rad51d n=1 Tax=Perkinsus chesapeaki TaxID=330153 RepID=A0A7J6KS65_PERCH|nr:DNA repair protein rad51d [Perkinsus chesapeaki]
MSIAARVLSSDNGNIFWYDTERTLHPQRFKWLCEKQSTQEYPIDAMLSRMKIKECDDLLDLVRGVEALKCVPPVEGPSVVIVDSIAAAARCTEDITLTKLGFHSDKADKELMVIAERQGLLNRLAAIFKEIAFHKGTAVIVSNHVTADCDSSKNDAFKPALGLTWSHAINYRVLISRISEDSSERCVSLVKSSHQPTPRSVLIKIDP